MEIKNGIIIDGVLHEIASIRENIRVTIAVCKKNAIK